MNRLPYDDSLSLPVVAAPMFLISGPRLVIEACSNGVLGTFPALNQRSTQGFDEWLCEIEESLEGATQASGKGAAPYGVNLIVHRTNLGADLAYLGTRFINTTESRADEAYRKMIIESATSDIVYTAVVSGVPANFLRSSLEAMGITQEMWSQAAKIDFGEELDEAKAWKTLWSAGQGVATIRDTLPVGELVARLKEEFHAAVKAQTELLERYP